MTVAHCSLPLGSICDFRNPENGARGILRVIDTGPWAVDSLGNVIKPLRPHPTRDFDLSKAAFELLSGGDLERGVMSLEFRVIGRDVSGLKYNL